MYHRTGPVSSQTMHTLPATSTTSSSPAHHAGILEQLDLSSTDTYTPLLPPLETVFPVTVINEIMSNGRTQNLVIVYLPRDATFENVQPALEAGAQSWQTRMWDVLEDKEIDGEGKIKREGTWMYQVVKHDGLPETKFRALDSEREWRALRKCVVEGKGEVVVWAPRTYNEMRRRKAQFSETEGDSGEDEWVDVDFHNVCELDLESLPPFARNRGSAGEEKKVEMGGTDDGDGGEVLPDLTCLRSTVE